MTSSQLTANNLALLNSHNLTEGRRTVTLTRGTLNVGEQPFSIRRAHEHIRAPKSVAELRQALSDVSQNSSIHHQLRKKAHSNLISRFVSGFSNGRLCGTVVILLVGQTGSGKSRTVNKLVGQNLLETGRYASTTKVIQRVAVPAVQHNIELELAFDDTPGLGDTTFADREQNAVLFDKYCQNFISHHREQEISDFLKFLAEKEHEIHNHVTSAAHIFRSRVYPNAILVNASWVSVKRDAQNDINNFTSHIGRSLVALATSGLYDSERPNVVVVITHSLSGYDTDCQDMVEAEAANQWREDALAKEAIIQDIAVKIFGPGHVLPVAFVENGSSEKALRNFRKLPNGEQSHRNLFFALKALFERNDGNGSDIQGLQSLIPLVGGEELLKSTSTIARSVIDDLQDDRVTERVPSPRTSSSLTLQSTSTTSGALISLARLILGTTYNPLTGRLGTRQVVRSSELHMRFTNDSRFSRLTLSRYPTSLARQLNIPFKPKHLYEHDYRPVDAPIQDATWVFAIKEIAVASIDDRNASATSEVISNINSLPSWDGGNQEVMRRYKQFFSTFGTHFLKSASLGGFISFQLSSDARLSIMDLAGFLQTGQGALCSGYIFHGAQCDGGAASRSTVNAALRDFITSTTHEHRPSASTWVASKARWMNVLHRDPIFLMNELSSNYEWIYNAGGISGSQRSSLKEASRWYLEDEGKVINLLHAPAMTSSDASDTLPRTDLKRSAEESIEENVRWISSIADPIFNFIMKGVAVAGTVAAVGAAILILG